LNKQWFVSEVPLAQAPPPAPTQTVIAYTTVPATVTTTTTTSSSSVGTNTNGVSMGVNVDDANVGVGANANGVSMGVHVNDADAGVNFNMDVNIGGNNTGTTTYSETTTTTTSVNTGNASETVVYVPGYSGNVGCPIPMTPQDFQNARNTISSKSFDDSKLAIAKQIINSNCLTSAQVKDLMILLDFESSKLDFAKYCYGYTYDLGNYYIVNDAFDFDSSADELNEYINAR